MLFPDVTDSCVLAKAVAAVFKVSSIIFLPYGINRVSGRLCATLNLLFRDF
jgi:hypothetical protein